MPFTELAWRLEQINFRHNRDLKFQASVHDKEVKLPTSAEALETVEFSQQDEDRLRRDRELTLRRKQKQAQELNGR